MRAYYYKVTAAGDLQKLRALKDIEMINGAVKELAAGTKTGFLVPMQSPMLPPKQKLYQYQVGRYKLNYTVTKTELNVVSVFV